MKVADWYPTLRLSTGRFGLCTHKTPPDVTSSNRADGGAARSVCLQHSWTSVTTTINIRHSMSHSVSHSMTLHWLLVASATLLSKRKLENVCKDFRQPIAAPQEPLCQQQFWRLPARQISNLLQLSSQTCHVMMRQVEHTPMLRSCSARSSSFHESEALGHSAELQHFRDLRLRQLKQETQQRSTLESQRHSVLTEVQLSQCQVGAVIIKGHSSVGLQLQSCLNIVV